MHFCCATAGNQRAYRAARSSLPRAFSPPQHLQRALKTDTLSALVGTEACAAFINCACMERSIFQRLIKPVGAHVCRPGDVWCQAVAPRSSEARAAPNNSLARCKVLACQRRGRQAGRRDTRSTAAAAQRRRSVLVSAAADFSPPPSRHRATPRALHPGRHAPLRPCSCCASLWALRWRGVAGRAVPCPPACRPPPLSLMGCRRRPGRGGAGGTCSTQASASALHSWLIAYSRLAPRPCGQRG